MTKINDLHRRWSRNADYKDAYDALGEEFDLARTLIKARPAADLSQSQLAKRMNTSQSYIARIILVRSIGARCSGCNVPFSAAWNILVGNIPLTAASPAK